MDVNLFRDVSREAFQASRLVCLGPDALEQVGFLGGLLEDQHPLVYVQDPNKAPLKEFGDLENWANSEGKRKEWEGKVVRVIGQFSPSRNNDKVFHLVRQRIQCCGADAVFLRVPIFSSESLTHVKRNDWVQVVGQVGFVPLGKGHVTILSVPGQRAIRPTSPAASFYIR